MCPLDAAFRGWRVGTDDVDVEVLHCTTKLCVADSCDGFLGVHTEGRCLVAVERHWLAIASEVALTRGEVVERRLRACESKLQKLAGRVIDEDKQRAAWASIFEPVMVAAIDLDELAEAVPSGAWWLRPSASLCACPTSRRLSSKRAASRPTR